MFVQFVGSLLFGKICLLGLFKLVVHVAGMANMLFLMYMHTMNRHFATEYVVSFMVLF